MTEQEAVEMLDSFYEMDEMYAAAQIAIKALEEVQQYRAIGTPEECRAAVEKQKEMKAYCDENDCSDCPFHNTNSKYNKCMNDFIVD